MNGHEWRKESVRLIPKRTSYRCIRCGMILSMPGIGEEVDKRAEKELNGVREREWCLRRTMEKALE